MKVLILTLHAGENEIQLCIDSVKNQTYKSIEHVIFKDLDNVEAHSALYSEIEKRSKYFDLFIKLDADMVFIRDTAVNEVVDYFRERRQLDHLQMTVFDVPSQSPIFGIHAFSNRVRWESINDSLLVDVGPEMSGYFEQTNNAPSPLALHMPSPSEYQSYVYGFHRALKIVQRDRARFNVSRAKMQFLLLKRIFNEARNSNDKKRFTILLGSIGCFKSDFIIMPSKESKEIVDSFEILSGQSNLVKKVLIWWNWSNLSPLLCFRYLKYVLLLPAYRRTSNLKIFRL